MNEGKGFIEVNQKQAKKVEELIPGDALYERQGNKFYFEAITEREFYQIVEDVVRSIDFHQHPKYSWNSYLYLSMVTMIKNWKRTRLCTV